jgi:uncharacterized membrane protein YhhN
MERRADTWILIVYWLVLVLSAAFLYFDLPYTIVSEPLLVPLLLLYALLGDSNIGKPRGKFIFYIGLLLAFAGDVLQVVISNELFFIASLVAFMLMNICYSISFYYLNQPQRFFWTSFILLAFASYLFLSFFGKEMTGYVLPMVIYMCTLAVMISLSVNVAGSERYRKIAFTYLIPGSLVFLLQNIILAINLFHLGGHNSGYVLSVIPYGIAQYMMVKGVKAAANIEY